VAWPYDSGVAPSAPPPPSRLAARARAALALALLAVVAVAQAGCRKPRYDTSTPERMVEAMQRMVADGRPELLLDLVWLEPRPITYADGVTEASAIEDVRAKAKDMVAQLWRVSRQLNTRFPREVQAELARGAKLTEGGSLGDVASRVIADPFGWLDANRDRLRVEDLGDGTASIEIDGAPVLGGIVTLAETRDGWRLVVPAEIVRATPYFPDTREEWAVVAYLMLALENALNDFEAELSAGKFRSLAQASDRAGRLLAEGAAAQAIIYALMQQNQPGAEKGGAAAPPLERTLGQTGDAFRREFERR
jgi:hypothetical protein